jgi:toxin ParE1/3/4
MTLSIERTAQAEEDLISIWLFIAQDSPAAADRMLDRIASRWALLAEHPYSGMARDDIAPGIRHVVVGQYVTLYRVADRVEILRVLHGKRSMTADDVL